MSRIVQEAIENVWRNTKIGRRIEGQPISEHDEELRKALSDAMQLAAAGKRMATIYAIGRLVELMEKKEL